MNINNLIYILFILAGMFFIGMAINLYLRVKKVSESWQKVPGTVVSSELSVSHSRNSKGYTSTRYIPKIVYEYSVNGQNYQSDKIGIGPDNFGRKKANEKIAAYPQGSKVEVLYDPGRPDKSALKTKTYGAFNYILLGAILILTSVWVMFFISE